MLLLSCETLALAYAAGIAAVAVVTRPARTGAALLAAAGLGLFVLAVAAGAPMEWRLVAPLVYLLIGYWAPALLVRRDPRRDPISPFERWLLRSDERLRPRMPPIPSRAKVLSELAYLFCYPLVPLAFVLAWAHGTPAELDRFWVFVLASGYACYAALPWLPSRPPRILAAFRVAPAGVRALNALVLGRFSHGWNTFPSGHVAVASAAAAALWRIWPAAGLLVAALAAAVGVGAAAGRYHYVVDVFAGVLVAILVAMVTW